MFVDQFNGKGFNEIGCWEDKARRNIRIVLIGQSYLRECIRVLMKYVNWKVNHFDNFKETNWKLRLTSVFTLVETKL